MNVAELTATLNLNVQSANISPSQFTDWLKGFLDGVGQKELTAEQLQKVVDKLATVSPYAGWYFSNPYPVAPVPAYDPLAPWQPVITWGGTDGK